MYALVLLLRFTHVLSAVLWVGGIALLTLFVLPAIAMAGSVGGQFMQIAVQKTRMVKYLPAVGGLTVLSGILLYGLDSRLSGGAFAKSTMGITLAIGGLFGLVALIVGGTMSARSAKELAVIG